MSYAARLCGFDVRRSPEFYVQDWWDSVRRASFLLRPDISWPLSVDVLVWPSMFRSLEPLPPGYERVGGFDDFIDADPAHVVEGLWDDLPQMRRAFQLSSQSKQRHGVEVSIEVIQESGADSDGFDTALLTRLVSPAVMPPSHTFLGYDIADLTLTSGLANCSYNLSEKKLLNAWAEKLNEFGLFPVLDDAMDFKRLTDERVSEHAPFLVFGLHRLS